MVATVPNTLPNFAEIRDIRRHFTAGSQKERTANIRNQELERKTKLSMSAPLFAM